MENKKLRPLIVTGILVAVILLIFSSRIFYTVDAGHTAVVFYKFSGGLDKNNVIGQGLHTKAPWNDAYIYDVREKTKDEGMDVLDKNGLSINVDVTVRFHPQHDRVGYLHESFGRSYDNNLVIPEVRSSVRQVMGRYSAEEIYSTQRAQVENAIKSETEKVLGKNNIVMKTLLIRSINLPPQIKKAIENKLEQEQEALAYQFRLQKEKSEAERKKIAAEGEATANNIVNSSLTDKLLKMRGIEATLELSKSNNAKTVIVGSSKDGLPLILGNN